MNAKIRQVKLADLVHIEEMAKSEDFHIGLHNWRLYFATSPECWQVAEKEDGEIIGYKVDNLLPGRWAKHAFQLVVGAEHRGQGLTRFFDTMQYSRCKIPCTANATKVSLRRYKFDSFGDRLLGFYGNIADPNLAKPKVNTPKEVHFQTAISSDIDEVVKYDTTVCGFDRKPFVQEWLFPKKFPCFSQSILAKNNNTICGYGTLREYDGYYAVAPLYADSDAVASYIFYEIVKFLDPSTNFYFLTTSNCRTMIDLMQQINMECCDDELRTFRHFDGPNSERWKMKKVYAMHDFYPV